MLKSAFLLETRNSFTFDQVDRRIEGRVGKSCCTGVWAESQTIIYKQHVAADVELTGEACSGCWDVGNVTIQLTGASRF